MNKRIVFVLLLALVLLGGCGGTKGWATFESEDGRFSILFPGKPEEQTESVSTVIGTIETEFFMVEQRDMAYSLNYADYPAEVVTASDVGMMLDGARMGAVANVNGELLDEKEITLDGYPGREIKVEVEEDDIIVRACFYLAENRLYAIQAISKKSKASSEDIDKFLDL
jgi:hypothetical protein